MASVGAAFRHFAAWKTVVGADGQGTEADVAAALGTAQLSAQQRLVAGLLAPANLLDVVRHFTLFMTTEGQTVKAVCRYPQYRAVNRAALRLRTGKTRLQDGEFDRGGGIVWHTQGSGKSLTMVFLIRKLRTDPALRRFKVVVVTDRTDLEDPLADTAALSGETVDIATSAEALRDMLRHYVPTSCPTASKPRWWPTADWRWCVTWTPLSWRAHPDATKSDPLAFLIVKSMLLTGFDAPIEGVMYLDRPIREAELLQTIARVNRTGHGKKFGIVVDYFGLAHHLKEALNVYAEDDITGALQSLQDQVPVLRDRHLRVVDLFRRRGVERLADHEACVELLADERLRAEFAVKLKAFLDTLDVVLPRPEGLPFAPDAKLLAFIYARARNRYRYRDTPVLGKDVGAKVRKLIDDPVISMGVDPKIAPVSLTDADFGNKLAREPNDRAKASEMAHAIRAHSREHLDQDPVAYRKLSERLRELLDKLGGQWDELSQALRGLADEIRTGHVAPPDGLPDLPAHYGPFLRLMADAAAGVRVQDLGYRWGSCGKGDWLYFHWKTILLPARIAEYVVVHEMAHLLEPHHTPAFWRRVARAMPDLDWRKQWLRDHGMAVEGL